MQNQFAFSNVVQGIEVDNSAFTHVMEVESPAIKKYIVFFTPRSGSSWLTRVLSSTKLLGTPEEYINPEFLPEVIKVTNSKDQRGILDILMRICKSKNVFGIEVRGMDIELYGESEFFSAFNKDTVVFNLWRDNLIAQGISLFRAVSTKRFHSTSPAVPPPEYCAGGIREWIEHIVDIENSNILIIERHGLIPRVLRYEDIVRSRATAIAIFADAVRVDIPRDRIDTPEADELGKIGDGWNREAEITFRRENRAFVEEIEARRLIKREPPIFR